MAQPYITDPPTKGYSLDPAYDDLNPKEQTESWWRGSDDPVAVQDGVDVSWAHDEYFPSNLGRSVLKDKDWARVAYFIAAGVSVTEVAKYFGVSRTTIWRGMQRAPDLRRRIWQERRMLQRESDARFTALRQSVVAGLQQAIAAGNVRVLLWAAERLDLGGSVLPRAERTVRGSGRRTPDRLPADLRRKILAADRTQDDNGGVTTTPQVAPTPEPPAPPIDIAPSATILPDPTAGAAASPEPVKNPKAATPPRSQGRKRREATRQQAVLLGQVQQRHVDDTHDIPELAEGIDPKDFEVMQINSSYEGLGRLVVDNDGPLDPYRPLRNYRWP